MCARRYVIGRQYMEYVTKNEEHMQRVRLTGGGDCPLAAEKKVRPVKTELVCSNDKEKSWNTEYTKQGSSPKQGRSRTRSTDGFSKLRN